MAVVRYLVSDVDVAVEFYVNMLGFELVERWGQRWMGLAENKHVNICWILF